MDPLRDKLADHVRNRELEAAIAWTRELSKIKYKLPSERGKDVPVALLLDGMLSGNLDEMQWLPVLALSVLRLGANTDSSALRVLESNGEPLLNKALRLGKFKAAIWMLAGGADPNRVTGDGVTALMAAAMAPLPNDGEIISYLGNGMSQDLVMAKDSRGKTAMDYAEENGVAEAFYRGIVGQYGRLEGMKKPMGL